jgi:hypothetical protein
MLAILSTIFGQNRILKTPTIIPKSSRFNINGEEITTFIKRPPGLADILNS